MLKFSFYRDLMNPDPEKRKKIKGLIITIGRRCLSSCYCNKASKCRYKKGHKFNNAIVRFRNFIYRKFKINLPQIIFIGPHDVDLSGTTKCPYHMPRRYTCWDCQNAYGMDNCRIPFRDRKPLIEETDGFSSQICGSYVPNQWADSWNRKTGEHIY